MRGRLGYDRDLLGEDEPSNDLVLGAPALLGIFFALALICAVCFGFGYSSGHGFRSPAPVAEEATPAPQYSTPARRAEPVPAAPAADIATDPPEEQGEMASVAPPVAAPAPAIAKPAPGTGMGSNATRSLSTAPPDMQDSVPATAPRPVRTLKQQDAQGEGALADDQPQAPALSVKRVPVAPVPSSSPAASEAAPVGPSVSLMVQIAAVSRAADAQTLSTALRHDGFAAIVRTTTGDPFFHVQVGPYSSVEAAKAMRAKLADNGYNAFIKP